MIVPFHRLTHVAPKSAWWKPLVTGLIAFGFFVVFTFVLIVVVMIAYFTDPLGAGVDLERFVTEGVIDNSRPIVLVLSLGSVIFMLPAILLARLIMGPRPLGLISSVAGRLRWGWMLRLVLPAVVVFLVVIGAYFFLVPPGLSASDFTIGPETWLLVAITILLVPLQATAEEYVFRGYLMQAIGQWLRHPAWAILLPVPLFMAGHLYDVWGLLDVGVFAVFAGWLTWRTGGLEAAIVAHVVNNLLIFLVAAFGAVDINSTDGDPVGVLVTVLTLGLYSLWVVRLQRATPVLSGGDRKQTREL